MRSADPIGFDSDFVVDGALQPLFATQVSFRGLNRNVPEQELDLIQFTARQMAEPGAGAPQVVGAVTQDPSQRVLCHRQRLRAEVCRSNRVSQTQNCRLSSMLSRATYAQSDTVPRRGRHPTFLFPSTPRYREYRSRRNPVKRRDCLWVGDFSFRIPTTREQSDQPKHRGEAVQPCAKSNLRGVGHDSPSRPASSTSRTLRASAAGVKGFWRKAVFASSTP